VRYPEKATAMAAKKSPPPLPQPKSWSIGLLFSFFLALPHQIFRAENVTIYRTSGMVVDLVAFPSSILMENRKDERAVAPRSALYTIGRSAFHLLFVQLPRRKPGSSPSSLFPFVVQTPAFCQ
jgi:hypothetical protein